MTSIAESLKRAERMLASSGIADPRREAVSLLTAAAGKDKTFIYAHGEYELTGDEERLFDSHLQRRAGREPLQYIAGIQEFYGLEFEVTPDVLIPRAETEMVVERALELVDAHGFTSFCEVGIGSGCIAVSILHNADGCHAVGLDISPAAIRVAGRNAKKHGVDDRLKLFESDVFAGLSGQSFDLILSNPPYVPLPDMSGLQAEVRDHEPRVALTDGADGLSIVRRIVTAAPSFLRQKGFLLLEIGFGQSEQVADMFDADIWQSHELHPDLQGIPRLVLARTK
jgi:release factor glutamine methyltransferase